MFCLTQQTVYQNELVGRPTDRLDCMLGDTVRVVQQRDMRRKGGVGLADFEPGFCHRRAQSFLKMDQRTDTIAAKQNVRIFARPGDKTQGAVQCDVKRRRGGRGCRTRLLGHGDDVRRQSGEIAEVVQGNVEALRQQRFAAQSVLVTESCRKPFYLRGGTCFQKEGEEQAIGWHRFCIKTW